MKTIGYGIVGTGYFGAELGRIMQEQEGAKIVAVLDPENGETIAQELGCAVETDLDALCARPDVDALIVATPNYLHKEPVLTAARHKKHVFCEKPVDHDIDKIIEVKKALQGSKVKYQVGFNRRFDHNFAAVREAVKAGKIGNLNVLKICSRDPAAPPVSYIKVSGGIFLDMTIHDFDMVRFLSGDEVESVFAMGGVMVDKAIGEAGDIDTAIITLRLKSGALAVIDNCRRAQYGYDQRAEAFGELGQVAITNDSASNAVLSNCDGVTAEKPLLFFLERYMQAYVNEITQFIDCIVNDKQVPVSIEDGLQAVVIGVAAKKSLEEGRPVSLDEITK